MLLTETWTGLPEDQHRHMTCLVYAYIAGYIQHYFIKNPLLRHLWLGGLGAIVLLYCHGWATLHLMGSAAAIYLSLPWIHPNRLWLIWTMQILLLIHMSHNQLMRQWHDYEGHVFCITGPHMVLLIKLSTLIWSVHDRHVDPKTLTLYQKDQTVSRIPSLFEYVSFVCCLPGVLFGPVMTFNEYKTFQERPTLNYSTLKPSLQSFVVSTLYLAFWFFGTSYLPLRFIVSDAALVWPWYQRLAYVYVALIAFRCKFYFAWVNGEGAMQACGLGYSGLDPVTKEPKWDLIDNIHPMGFEKAANFRDVLNHWNRRTNLWLKECWYLRFTAKGGFGASLMTYFVSAVWHGFYPGYYLTFGVGALIAESSRLARHHIRPLFVKAENEPILYTLAAWFLTQFYNCYALSPFHMLGWLPSLLLWERALFGLWPTVVLITALVVMKSLPNRIDDDAIAFRLVEDSKVIELTFMNIKKDMKLVMDALSVIGVVGCRVALIIPTSYAIFVCALSIWKCHAVMVPLSERDYNDDSHSWPLATSVSIQLSNNGIKLCDGLCIRIQCHPKGCKRIMEREPISYIMQTSGTTSHQRKSVRVPVSTMKRHAAAMLEAFPVLPKPLTLWWTSPVTFDPTIVTWAIMLFHGGCIALFTEKGLPIPLANVNSNSLEKSKINTIISITPSQWRHLSSSVKMYLCKDPSNVIVMGGAPFPKELFHEKPKAQFYNIYGTTECSVWATLYSLEEHDWESKDSPVPLGVPILETEFQVRDPISDEIIVCEEGASGVVYLGGKHRCCYLNEETSFILLRNTGDRVSAYPSANGSYFWYWNGRIDLQMKRHGHRIALDVYAERLSRLLQLVTCALSVNDLLIVLVEGNVKAIKVDAVIRQHFSDAYFPDQILIVHQLPLNENGKLDRSLLTESWSILETADKLFSTDFDAESFLLHAIRVLIDTKASNEQILNATWFRMGGTSMDAFRLWTQCQQFFDSKDESLLECILHRPMHKVLQYLKENSLHNVKKQRINDIDEEMKSFDMLKCIDASPIVLSLPNEESVAFIGSHAGLFVALDCETMKPLWQVTLPGRLEASASLSPCHQFIIIGCYDHKVYCFNVKTGDKIMEYETGEIVKTTAVWKGNSAWIGSHDKWLHRMDLDKNCGEPVYQVDGSIFAVPCLNDNLIFVPTLNGSVYALTLDGMRRHWKQTLNGAIFASPLLANHLLIVATVKETVYALNYQNGNILWQCETHASLFSSPRLFEDDSIVFGTYDRRVLCLNLNGSIIHEWQVSDNVYASPLVYNRNIFVACIDGSLWQISKGNAKSFITLPGACFSSPAVLSSGYLLIGCRDNHIYRVAIKPDS